MFTRIVNLFKGFVGMFLSGLEKRNPEALLELEKENLRKQIGRFNEGLASHAGLCESLMAQVKRLETEERDLASKAGANLKAGNRDAAGQYALKLQKVQRELEDNRQQLKQAEETYRNLTKSRDVAIAAAKSKIEELKNSIGELKMKRAMADLSEMASGMITQVGGSGDTLDRLEGMVKEESQKAAGRARVARDTMDMSQVKVQEAEEKELANQALAEFAAKEGIVLTQEISSGASTASDVQPKSMVRDTEKS